ncbi:MAG TPA: PilC/PilY family type IV pilus protein [Burkholderiales bacterium]|nr:PilC/PilY family type IV pilus protein [Burkholderiales bacterium]
MKRICCQLLRVAIAIALAVGLPPSLHAEDVDLFLGAASGINTTRPNVLIVIDNSANWSAASQHWVGGVKQGQSELRALRTLVGELTDSVNLGLMLFTPGSGSNPNGAYVRYHVRQMTAGNKGALQELIGDGSCADGPNSLNGTPNCIFKNFDTATEKVGTAKTDYSAGLFEVFKYLGGFTSPANAQTGIAGSPVDSSHFGQDRYSGDPDLKSDPDAYLNGISDPLKRTYKSPIDINNNCAKTYVIFIGNGFPTQDSPSTLLAGIQGDTTQLPMPQFTTISQQQCTNLGSTNTCSSSCSVPGSITSANPGFDSYQCVVNNALTTSLGCSGSQKAHDYQGCNTALVVTPTGTTAVPPNNEVRYVDEWAKYLFTTDVSPEAGQQNASVYTIDVFKDAQDSRQTGLLMSVAKYGGGRYFSATSEQAILNALREILIEIQAVNSVFASASLPINATNRSQNENQVFIGMFRPDPNAKPKWYGNLKRYQVGLFGSEAKLADKNGAEAVSAATGFVQSCASSFYTTDSGAYWNFSPISAGLCTVTSTSPFSDLPDGALVEKGAVSEVIRRGNDPTAAIPTTAVNRTVYTCPLNSTTCSLVPFNTSNVGASRVQAANSTEHQRIIDFTLGMDVNDENGNNIFNETRPSLHGDVTHSRPLPVNYGGSTGVVVYYGSNEGTFRAISGDTGRELWSFIGSEHHRFLKRLYANSPIVTYPGLPTGVTSERKNYFFDGSAGLYQTANNSKVWVFPSMRRGGRRIYAFDVTNPAVPALKWRMGCAHLTDDVSCTSGSTEIGETWSTPAVATVAGFNGGNDPLIVMGGGYDSCEDADTSAPSCASAKGRKVYVLDADTGAILQSFDTLRSVPADVTLVDRNFDGQVDHGYVVDTGGNIYRIDFVNPLTLGPLSAGNWTITHIARTNDPSTNPAAGRKFLFAPAVLPAKDRVYLALGSGDRERPLQVNYPFVEDIRNRLYMFVDNFQTAGPVDLDGATLADFTTNTTCSTTLGSGFTGWRMDLDNGRGEQTVTSAAIFGGLIFFSTNRPVATVAGQCASNLGEARGYAVNLLNASGAVNTQNLCGADRSGIFIGGGLPPSPVVGSVPVAGRQVTVVIGGIQRSGGASSPIAAQRVQPTITQRRARLYWYQHGDK